MNLNPVIWGPHAWVFLDSVILTMPDVLDSNQIILYTNFFKSLQFLLPCKTCKLHYGLYLDENPLTEKIVSKKETMLEWFHNLHNKIRKRQDKSERTLTEMLTYYKNLYLTEDTGNKKMEYYILIIIAIFLLFSIFKIT